MKRKMPNTPFSTRLSGGTKETELRIRNIFQWKKKRPPVVLFVLVALLMLLCFGLVSCVQETAPEVTPEMPPEVMSGDLNQDKADETEFSFADLTDYEFYFSSGAGAWATRMMIQEDGSFSGEYHDSDMGVTGDGYPNGTQYSSIFRGRFAAPEKVNDYTWSTTITQLDYEQEADTEEILGGVRYIYSEAYGLQNAQRILIYLPGAPLTELPLDFLSWVGYYDLTSTVETELPFYGFYNENDQTGFSGHIKPEHTYDQTELSGLTLDEDGEGDDFVVFTIERDAEGALTGNNEAQIILGNGKILTWDCNRDSDIYYWAPNIIPAYLTSPQRQCLAVRFPVTHSNYAACRLFVLEVKDGTLEVTDFTDLYGPAFDLVSYTPFYAKPRSGTNLEQVMVVTYAGKTDGKENPMPQGALTWDKDHWNYELTGAYMDPEASASMFDKTMTLLPVNKEVFFDLNSDGAPEAILVTLDQTNSGAGHALHINGTDYTGTLTKLGIYSDNPDPDLFAITDLDKSDGLLEIALPDDGPSGDPNTKFLRWDGVNLTSLGETYGKISDNDLLLDGAGTVASTVRLSVLQTWFAPAAWHLGGDGKFTVVPQKLYLQKWDQTVTALKDLAAYEQNDAGSTRTVLSVGTKFALLGTDNDQWVLCAYPDGDQFWLRLDHDTHHQIELYDGTYSWTALDGLIQVD